MNTNLIVFVITVMKNIFMAMSDDMYEYDRDVSPFKELPHANDPIPHYDSP
jgi:hypothetical protein